MSIILKLSISFIIPILEAREDQSSIRKDITQLISEGTWYVSYYQHSAIFNCYPEAITHVKGANMNYQNYAKSIVIHYSVKLIGWPEQIPFGTPLNIRTVPQLRLLRRALQTTACRWTRLDETEMEELTESILSHEGNGEIVGKKRKERSDKGGSHKPKKRKNKDDHARGQKHARKGAKLPDINRSRSAEDSDGSDNSADNEDGIE